MDLEAYLRRIGYEGAHSPTLDTLRAVLARHTEVLAFENLDPLLKRPVRLDLEAIQRKMVRGGRGGYCYEQNILLCHALQALGFKVTSHAARVLWNAAVTGLVPPRTHMLLRVDLGGQRWLADAGFGLLTPTGPLRLETSVEQETPHEQFRLADEDEEFVLQARIRDEWKALYRFDLQVQLLSDYEISNWYISTHPGSRFVNELMAARPAPGRRYTLFGNEYAVHHLNGKTEKRTLASAAEFREVLERDFHLTLPQAPELEALLQRLVAPAR